jgi:hypothetical protein
MREVQKLLERQARWQKGRAALSWPEKIRMAEAIRESVRALRKGAAGLPKPDRDTAGRRPARQKLR